MKFAEEEASGKREGLLQRSSSGRWVLCCALFTYEISIITRALLLLLLYFWLFLLSGSRVCVISQLCCLRSSQLAYQLRGNTLQVANKPNWKPMRREHLWRFRRSVLLGVTCHVRFKALCVCRHGHFTHRTYKISMVTSWCRKLKVA